MLFNQQSAIIFLDHHYPHTTTNMMAPSDIRTTTDKKFEHAKQIYAIAERWHDAIVVLQELCCAIGDRTSSRNSLLEKSSFVKKNRHPPYV